ncbi:MAG: hypothetical protein LBF94_00535 [Puniceicoccales bacterium]|jgi:hypothetical protein|nr:hypothetical protein [Puniceicoccales bacterium]
MNSTFCNFFSSSLNSLKTVDSGQISNILGNISLLTIAHNNGILRNGINLAAGTTKLASIHAETGNIFLSKSGKVLPNGKNELFFSITPLLETIDTTIGLILELAPICPLKGVIKTILFLIRLYSVVYDAIENADILPREKLWPNIIMECAKTLAKLAIVSALLSFNATLNNWFIIGIMAVFLVKNWQSNKKYKFIHSTVEELYLSKIYPEFIKPMFLPKKF